MVISMEQYAALRQDFLQVAKFHIKSLALDNLKYTYKTAINSMRDSDYIEDIEDLIRILEKRGVIRYDNVTPLKHIAKTYLNDSTILGKIQCYESWIAGYCPPYIPQTNLYRHPNGECHLQKTIKNNLSSNSNYNIRPSNHIFPCVSPLSVIDNDDPSDSNNSAVTICSLNDPRNDVIPLTNNVSIDDNHDDRNQAIKDCKIRIGSYETYNVAQNKKENVVSKVTVPLDSILKHEKNNKPSESTHSSTRDLDGTDKTFPNTPLLSTPSSVAPQTTVCYSVTNALRRSSSKHDINIVRNRLCKFIQRRYVKISSIVLLFVITLSTIFIVYGFLKNSVHYNLEASAPSFQEVHTGHHETSSNPCAGYSSQCNQSRNAVYNARPQTLAPLQILSEREARLQNKVFDKVSRELGVYWQDMARGLGIREYEINNIDQQFVNLQEKALAALKMFANETDLDHWQRTLKKALEKARRKDLMEVVEELASRRF